MKQLLMSMVMVLAFTFGALGSVSLDGPVLVAEAQAAEAKVSVAVIKATKSGTTDDKSKKYNSVISQIGGFSGFTHVADTSFSATVGTAVDKKLAGRTLSVTVKSASGDKVSTAVTVIDPNGKKHAVSSSTKPGASVVVAAKSADGSEAHLFIVTVR
jgi:hypothetical protein